MKVPERKPMPDKCDICNKDTDRSICAILMGEFNGRESNSWVLCHDDWNKVRDFLGIKY